VMSDEGLRYFLDLCCSRSVFALASLVNSSDKAMIMNKGNNGDGKLWRKL
jgi:hypothetical protein